jgi:polyphenol oxidase
MELLAKDKIPFLRFQSLPADGRITHAVFTRQGGTSAPPYDSLNLSVSVPDDRAHVYANRALAYGTHGRTTERLVHAYLVHGAEVAQVSQGQHGQHIGPVDGLMTDQPGCGLTMNYADCAPVFLYDQVHQAIALGHAGWKGAINDLPGALVRSMERAYGSRPEQLVAAIGPAIGPCCYEVGEPLVSAVLAAFSEAASLLSAGPESTKPHFDLPQAVHRRLSQAGVREIEQTELCTACRTDLFYSHRAEKGATGRFGAIYILHET